MATQTHAQPSSDALTLQNPTDPTNRLTVEEMFGQRFDDGVIEMTYELKTDRMKQFYRRDFVHLSQLFHAIDRYREVRQLDHVALDAVEKHIQKQMDALRALMHQTSNEGMALLTANGYADKEIHFSRPVTYIVPIISPFAREYMEILVLADDAFAKVRACHLLGLVKPADKVQIESRCRKGIRALAQTIRLRRINLAQYAQRVRDNADPEARKIIDAAVGREVMSLFKQAAEDPTMKVEVSSEHDLDRMAAAQVHPTEVAASADEANAPAPSTVAAEPPGEALTAQA